MEGTENKHVKSKRDLALERMRNKYPDRDFDDEEIFFGQINDDYDDYDKKLSGYQDREKTFSNMFSSDPRSAAFLTEWRKGGDPVISLVRQFGTDIKEAIDDPERQEAIAAANKEYVERVAREKELDDEYQSNIAASLKYLDELQQKNGLEDKQVDDAMEFLIGIIKDGILGKFSPESIDMAMKAINHDTDVAMANEEGEIKGRNANIEEKLRKREKSDGTARLEGGKGKPSQRHPSGIFDLAREAR